MPDTTQFLPLYTRRRHPYYVFAPGFDRCSSGIRVMHQLCDCLNRLGEEAYIYTPKTSPGLHTPQLTDDIRTRHTEAGLIPIAIYPEIVGANPLDCDVVVRYILNRPGLLGEKSRFGKDDLYWLHNEEVSDAVEHFEGLLHLPAVDTSIFHNRDNPDDQNRKGACIYYGRHTDGALEHPELAATCTVITKAYPASHEELAALFRRSTHVYCFENTSISMEARLCGCPVVQLPSPFIDLSKLFSASLGLAEGLILSDDEKTLAETRSVLPQLTERYKEVENEFWSELKKLVAKTQAVAARTQPHDRAKAPLVPDTTYDTWRSRQTLQEIDAQLLAERMVLKWSQRPGIHLLMALQPGEESLLADTLDSLASQLYPEWLLTVVTTLPKPPEADDTPQLQWLALRDAAHIDYVIDEMAAASPGSWLARIEPGLTLEPQALQVVADYINLQPGWQLIYTDEDCHDDTDGKEASYAQPRFKPDFNLDLLRAQAYFGSFVAVAKDSFLSAGRYGCHAGAQGYDLALRIVDQAGDAAVGHISQVLAHRPAGISRPVAGEAEKAALADHLVRRGLAADILDGPSEGVRRLLYLWSDTPLVSIIIQTRDREEYLRPLLDSIHARTRYPQYEIIVVDNGSTDPDTLAFLAALETEAPWAGRARVIDLPEEFNWSAGANAGAAVANGDYLLFLDNDTYVVHEEWLDRLMGIAQRGDVGIVGPRLTYPETAKVQHTGWVLGLGGSAGSPWNNTTGITEPCYMDRALCDQEVGAVSGSALLVRKALFAQLGGMNAARYPLLHGALDLCLRTGKAGSRIVWTPYSTLIHFNGVSMHANQRRPEGMLRFIIDSRSASDRLLEQWLPRLAHDPAYNRNLSLVEPYKVEHVAPIDWDTNFHDRPRILGVPLTGGAGEYRMRAPLRAISKAGLAQTMICEPPVAFSVRILTPVELARAAPDAIILHQPVDDPQTDALESYARFLPHVRRIITMDDLITALPEKNPSFKRRPRDARPRLRRALSLADRLVVSTRPLAELCADMIEDVRIMPNCLEWSLWGDVAPPRHPRKKPRVGWAGAQQHLGDLELIYPVVEALADEVDWIFMGMCPDPLKPFVRESHGFELDFTAYPAALARLDLDLAIAPLEIHAFNEAKSNLRLLEYGAMGWPVICTDIHPYQNAPVIRLPNEPEKWIRSIREQLAEPAALREAGLALQRWVHEGFILENHTASWFAAYGP